MRLLDLHPWDLTATQAVALQKKLAPQVVLEGEPSGVRFVAAADVAWVERAPAWAASTARAAVVVMSYPNLEIVEHHVVEAPTVFPYVPGLLSFRETPALAVVFERLKTTPDLLLADGHGYAHPRRFGFASHLGLLTGMPTIGVAKSRLCGEASEPERARGSMSELRDHGEVVGLVVRTKDRVKPLYVSVGNGISLRAAADWVLRLAPTHRLPEPARIADLLSKGRSADGPRAWPWQTTPQD